MYQIIKMCFYIKHNFAAQGGKDPLYFNMEVLAGCLKSKCFHVLVVVTPKSPILGLYGLQKFTYEAMKTPQSCYRLILLLICNSVV